MVSTEHLSGKQRKTLQEIFERPTRADIRWHAITSLFAALGADVTQGRGSRVRVALAREMAVFHEPHPANVTVKGAVESVRDFLERAGVQP